MIDELITDKMKHKEKNLLLKHEYSMKWRDLYKIRLDLEKRLQKLRLTRKQADPIVIILSELVENAFKYSDRKSVTIILKYTTETRTRINVKLHHPVASLQQNNLKLLLADISKVNAAKDLNLLFIQSLREAAVMNPKANRFRLALIRKTAGGALIHIKKSLLYKPGVSISLDLLTQ